MLGCVHCVVLYVCCKMVYSMVAISCFASLCYISCRWYRSHDQIITSIIDKKGIPQGVLAALAVHIIVQLQT